MKFDVTYWILDHIVTEKIIYIYKYMTLLTRPSTIRVLISYNSYYTTEFRWDKNVGPISISRPSSQVQASKGARHSITDKILFAAKGNVLFLIRDLNLMCFGCQLDEPCGFSGDHWQIQQCFNVFTDIYKVFSFSWYCSIVVFCWK